MAERACMNVADLVDPNDPEGRTYRQRNAARQHKIPVGALVEDIDTGVRLFVVHHGRDCDQTPLYYLSHDRGDTQQQSPYHRNLGWTGGFPEEALRAVHAGQTEKRYGIFRVSRELLASALLLPAGAEIIDVSPHLYFDEDQIALKVECPDFPAWADGARIPEIVPQYRMEDGKPVFVNWIGPDGQPLPGHEVRLDGPEPARHGG